MFCAYISSVHGFEQQRQHLSLFFTANVNFLSQFLLNQTQGLTLYRTLIEPFFIISLLSCIDELAFSDVVS